MELAQAAQQAGSLTLLGTAVVLGFRHGIDWDHIAAITDITSTTTNVERAEEELVTQPAPVATASSGSVALSRPRPTGRAFGRLELRALWLSSLYALGHAFVVALLGFA